MRQQFCVKLDCSDRQTHYREVSLSALHLLITRPKPQSDAWVQQLREQGLLASALPLLEIVPYPQPADLAARLAAADLVLAISVNAVNFAAQALQQLAAEKRLVQVFAIGAATAGALARLGVCAQAPQSSQDSETLLALPEWQKLQGKRLVILCGEGGRELIEHTAQQRGACVERCALYRRKPIHYDSDAPELQIRPPTHVLLMSGETLHAYQALHARVDLAPWRNAQLIVPSQRISMLAQNSGLNAPKVLEKVSVMRLAEYVRKAAPI